MNRKTLAIGATYFFLTGAPGFWMPVLSKILEANEWSQWLVLAFLIKPIASLISPLAISAQADQRIPAEKIVAVLLTLGAMFQILAFRELQIGESPARFLMWLSIQSLITAPTFALINTITFVYLDGQVSKFGKLRVWGTIGWIAAGCLVSLLRIDSSATVGYWAATSSLIAVVCCCFLPSTRPAANPSLRLIDKLGLTSLKLLNSRDIGAVIITSCLFMMPLTAFFMHTPLFIDLLGIDRIAVTMSIGQISEIFALIGMGYLMKRFSFRVLLTLGFAFAVARFVLFSLADEQSVWMLIVGIAFHGLCWTFFFEVGRAFLDQKAPVEFRAQIQALTTLGTSGAGSIAGTIIVGEIYRACVVSDVGWPIYWGVLACWCGLCGVGFLLVFRE